MLKASLEGALLFRFVQFCRDELVLLEACQNRSARRLLAFTRRNWDSEPKRRHMSNKDAHRKLGIVPIAMEHRSRRMGRTKRMLIQIQKDDFAHQQVFAVMFALLLGPNSSDMTLKL